MRGKKYYFHPMTYCWVLLVTCTSLVFAQSDFGDCSKGKRNDSPKYRVEFRARTVEGPPWLLLNISVKPKSFNRCDMIALARRLNKDFSLEPRLAVMMFDDREIARTYPPPGGIPNGSERGGYSIDRVTGKEILHFSTAPGRPYNEVEIVLGKPAT